MNECILFAFLTMLTNTHIVIIYHVYNRPIKQLSSHPFKHFQVGQRNVFNAFDDVLRGRW